MAVSLLSPNLAVIPHCFVWNSAPPAPMRWGRAQSWRLIHPAPRRTSTKSAIHRRFTLRGTLTPFPAQRAPASAIGQPAPPPRRRQPGSAVTILLLTGGRAHQWDMLPEW